MRATEVQAPPTAGVMHVLRSASCACPTCAVLRKLRHGGPKLLRKPRWSRAASALLRRGVNGDSYECFDTQGALRLDLLPLLRAAHSGGKNPLRFARGK